MLAEISIAVLVISLLMSLNLYKKYQKLKIKTSVSCHDIRASLAILNLILGSLKELITPEKKSQISLADLPALIEILEEAKNNLSQTVNQLND